MIPDILLGATERAARAVLPWVGRLEKKKADAAAVEAMRAALHGAAISGEVVIGEGEMDEAPMLYRGERVGAGGPAVAIAVDPLEGTNLVAKNRPGASCILLAGPMGSLLSAPDMYMDRLAGPPEAKGRISLEMPVEDMVRTVASVLGKNVSDVNVVMLDRDRHKDRMEAVRRAGGRLRLITDGDVLPSVLAGAGGCGVDLVLGVGGAPEGVLVAGALTILGGAFEGRLLPEDDDERARIKAMSLKEEILDVTDVVSDPRVAFAATAVTSGWGLQAPRTDGDWLWTTSLVLDGVEGTLRRVARRFPTRAA